MKYPQFFLLVALVVLAVVQAVWLQFQLPALVATHFNVAGRADGWMTRPFFLRFELLLVLGAAGLFTVLAVLTAVLPAGLINLPHRDYWLAPAREAETRRRLAGMVLASGCGALAFFIFLHQRLYQANVDGTHQLTPGAGVMIPLAFVLIAGPLIRPLVRFGRRPPDSGGGSR